MKKLLVLFSLAILIVSCKQNAGKLKEPNTEAELGELLFFDPILSSDSTITCASCHKPECAFADDTPVSDGVMGRKGSRNTPSAMNQTARNFMFWDGRMETLEEQALGPIENPVEMNLPVSELINRLYRHNQYKAFFNKIYGENPSRKNIAKAIAEYERTLETVDTPFDDYISKRDTTQMSESLMGRI